MKIKVKQLERYQSKDCLIFRNLSFGSNGTYLSVVIDLIQNVLNVNIEPRDLKGCHPLGKGSPFNPPPVIAKFVYFDQKERIWTRKGLLRNYRNSSNGKPVFILERLSKYDNSLKEEAQAKQLRVTTKNSAPLVQIESDGMKRYLVLNSIQDIIELQPVAIKIEQKFNYPKKLPQKQSQVYTTTAGSMEVSEVIYRTPVPKLTKQPIFAPGTPLSTKKPSLKRMRDNFENSDYTNLMEELKSRRADKDELLDFMGRISCSPNAKENSC